MAQMCRLHGAVERGDCRGFRSGDRGSGERRGRDGGGFLFGVLGKAKWGLVRRLAVGSDTAVVDLACRVPELFKI
jgi:hypothetical protein